MKTEKKIHTPTPWKIAKDGINIFIKEKGITGQKVRQYFIKVGGIPGVGFRNSAKERTIEAKANAEFIVRSVNSYEALLNICKRMYIEGKDADFGSPAWKSLYRALEKAIVQAIRNHD